MQLQKFAIEFTGKSATAMGPAIRLIHFETEVEISAAQDSPCWQVYNIVEYGAHSISRVIADLKALMKDTSVLGPVESIFVLVQDPDSAAIRFDMTRKDDAVYALAILKAVHTQWRASLKEKV